MTNRNELIVDTEKETKSLMVNGYLESQIPEIVPAFEQVDRAYLNDPEEYLASLKDSVFSFKSDQGGEVACSLLFNENSREDEILVMFAPFSDGSPKSSAESIQWYISRGATGSKPGFMDKQKAQPNSWNQATKSGTTFELLSALGHNLPVLTIFSPIPTDAYSHRERFYFRRGSYSPAGNIAKQAIDHSQTILHGSDSQTRLSKVHLQGASLGASNAVGAASEFTWNDDGLQVMTVTAQELILGPKNLGDLAARFTVRSMVGEPSMLEVPDETPRIIEPELRRAIDAHGNEIAMQARMINAMLKLSYLSGLTKPDLMVLEGVENLLDRNIPMTVALAENSALTHQTASHLPLGNENLEVVKIRAKEGQRAGHLVDEHVALTSTIAALGLRKR